MRVGRLITHLEKKDNIRHLKLYLYSWRGEGSLIKAGNTDSIRWKIRIKWYHIKAKRLFKSQGHRFLTINDNAATLPLKHSLLFSVYIYTSLFLPSDRVICWGIAYDSDTGKTNDIAERLTHHRGPPVARGSCCCCSCSSVHLGGDQVEAGAIARRPGQVPVHPWRGQTKSPWGVRSLHRKRVSQTQSWRTDKKPRESSFGMN